MSSISKSTRAKIASILGFDFVHVSTGKFFTDFPDKRKKRYTVRSVTDNTLFHLFEYEDGSINAVTSDTNIDLKALPGAGIKRTPARLDGEITPREFAALAKLLQSRGGAAESAARLVLIENWGPADAARETNLAPASVSNSVTRYRRAYALALIVAGRTPFAEPPDIPIHENSEWAIKHGLPAETIFLRERQIIGNRNPPILGLLPISRANWRKGIKSGKYPPPIMFGPTSVWKIDVIRDMIDRLSEPESPSVEITTPPIRGNTEGAGI